MRGLVFAVAERWLIRLPEHDERSREAKARALDHLESAGRAACEAYGWVPVLDEQLASGIHRHADLR